MVNAVVKKKLFIEFYMDLYWCNNKDPYRTL